MKFAPVIMLLLFFTLRPVSLAQADVQAQFTLSYATPLVGEPVDLTLTVTAPREAEISQWPDFDREWELFSVLDIGDLQINETGDIITYTQVYRIAFWYPGEYSTPDIIIEYALPGAAGSQQIEVTPAFLSIPSVLEGESLILRPLKPQIWLPYLPPLVVIAGIGVLVGAGFGAYYWRKRQLAARPGLDFDADLLASGSPAHVALSELKRIYQARLTPEQIFVEVADCLRVYIQAQFQVSTLDLTTDELIDALHHLTLPIPTDMQHELRRMLQQADLAKFARYQPNERNAKGYLNAAGKWIQAADELTQPETQPKDVPV